MLIFYSSLLFLLFMFIFRTLYNNYIQTKFKYSLYELRDRLRIKAIKGEINRDNYLFELYDHSLSNNIKDSYYVTLFNLLFKIAKFENNEEYIEFRKKLNSDLEKYPEFKLFEDEYTKLIRNYIQHQHIVSVLFITFFVSPIIGANQIVKKVNIWIGKILVHQKINNSNSIGVC